MLCKKDVLEGGAVRAGVDCSYIERLSLVGTPYQVNWNECVPQPWSLIPLFSAMISIPLFWSFFPQMLINFRARDPLC